MELMSGAFAHGEVIPRRYTCDGEDVSPPLAWMSVPPGAPALALLVDDPDAPGGSFTHWLAWGLDADAGGLREGQRAPFEGQNDFGTIGYRGPCPPPGRPHRYVFQLYALSAHPVLAPGSLRLEFERAIAPRTLATAQLVGTYLR
jgi:Raf kinase inhibitor-like YbhB/YbcL family protein